MLYVNLRRTDKTTKALRIASAGKSTYPICISAMDACYNPYDSYGEICVGCNCCGRVDKSTMYQCRIETDKRHLVETAQHLTDEFYQTELQQKNILSNIEYFIKQIRKSEAALKGGQYENG